MRITIYKCDLCKKESQDSKILYAPKSGAAVALMDILRERFKHEDVCTDCFNSFNDAVTKAVNELKHS